MADYDRKDAYYERAKAEGRRSRAAYKLDEILRKLPRLRPGDVVVDLGCWPGGWLQVLAERVGEAGLVVGIDVAECEPLPPPVKLLVGDLGEPETLDAVEAALDGRKARCLLSDAAPKLTGIKDVDRGAIEELYDAALALSARVLDASGSLVMKGFPGPEADRVRKQLRKRFPNVSEFRPDAKRATSKEFYWIASPPRPTRKRGTRGRRRRR